MSQRTKIVSKLSTLDAAKGIYFIIAGLAIRQSLALFSHNPDQTITNKYELWQRLIVGLGFVITALRFSHGISMLYGYEKEQVEKSTLPSPRKVFLLSAFLSLLAILFYLMADNIIHIRTFIICSLLMFFTDLGYIAMSGVVRTPKLTLQRWEETTRGSAACAALQWIISDVFLIIIAAILLLLDLFVWNFAKIHMVILAGFLILAAFADYWWNRRFYFGGEKDKRRQDIVFVCSPLQGGDMHMPLEARMRNNVRRAQWYCRSLMRGNVNNEDSVIPFASHSFYVYFLHDDNLTDRIIGQDCAIAYLHAYDAIYVYTPLVQDYRLKLFQFIKLFKKIVPDEERLSKGMKYELAEAKRLGLKIRLFPQKEIEDLPANWPSVWNPLQFEEPPTNIETHFDPNQIRKRVFVCSYLRGLNFDQLNNEQRKKCLEDNVSAALWYCHQLVRLPSKDGKEEIAPFAPQAFYPYFWDVLDQLENEGNQFEAWFERSIEVLKVCDAVYFYVKGGLPDDDLLSKGMKRIKELAESIGLEIQYKPTEDPPRNWKPALPRFPPEENAPDIAPIFEANQAPAAKRIRIYFAAPLFTQAEWQWNERLAETLRGKGFDIILPQAEAEPMLRNQKPFNAKALYDANTHGIESADIVLAILDQADPDSGTCWEYGYAIKAGTPVVCLRTDIRRTGDDPTNTVNLMLSQSWKDFLDVPNDRRNDVGWVAQQIAKKINRVMNTP